MQVILLEVLYWSVESFFSRPRRSVPGFVSAYPNWGPLVSVIDRLLEVVIIWNGCSRVGTGAVSVNHSSPLTTNCCNGMILSFVDRCFQVSLARGQNVSGW